MHVAQLDVFLATKKLLPYLVATGESWGGMGLMQGKWGKRDGEGETGLELQTKFPAVRSAKMNSWLGAPGKYMPVRALHQNEFLVGAPAKINSWSGAPQKQMSVRAPAKMNSQSGAPPQ